MAEDVQVIHFEIDCTIIISGLSSKSLDSHKPHQTLGTTNQRSCASDCQRDHPYITSANAKGVGGVKKVTFF
jgi:hypothetical protein